MKPIYSSKAYSSSFDTLIDKNKKKKQESENQHIPASTLKILVDSGIIDLGA